MRPSLLNQFRSLLGQLSRVAAGSRPDISALSGKISECVDDLRNLVLFSLSQLVSYVRETANLHTLKFPSAINVAELQVGIVADCAIGRLKVDGCVDPRAGRLCIGGDGFLGGNYHIFGRGSKELRKVVRASIARDAFAMAHASEAAGELPSVLGAICGAKFGLLQSMVASVFSPCRALAKPLLRSEYGVGTSASRGPL